MLLFFNIVSRTVLASVQFAENNLLWKILNWAAEGYRGYYKQNTAIFWYLLQEAVGTVIYQIHTEVHLAAGE